MSRCRTAAEAQGWPLAFVERPWLHVTIAQLADRTAAEYTAADRRVLAQELQAAAAEIEPFEVMVGSCLSSVSGLVFDLHPDDQLTALIRAVRAAIERACGPHAAAYDVGVPHMTLAYATGDADSGEIQRRFRRVRPSHAPMTIDALHLLDVAVHAETAFTWTEPLARVELGGQPQGVRLQVRSRNGRPSASGVQLADIDPWEHYRDAGIPANQVHLRTPIV
ncbi:2'-5' RNA ligase family protein [Actinomadura sp. 6N118]|uniref:2'-5' RNA ligase family protein n=1 Tax=Actinomadura sp. 6N118 TaxID=3375151 RepID=UPI0037976555